MGLNFWRHFLCCGLLWGGNRESGVGFEILGVVLYLRDCNNNHTSTTGLVASIILSTVDQKCMGVKTILVWVCGCQCAFCELQKQTRGGVKVRMYCGGECGYLCPAVAALLHRAVTRLCHRRVSASFTLIFHSRLLCTLTSLSSTCVCSVHC